MTGLDDQKDHILEVAAVITDMDFKPLEQYNKIVKQPQAVLDGMNDWCKKTHGASGLTAGVPGGAELAGVERELVAMLDGYFKPDHRIVLCGNSIGNDRRFIDRHLPLLAARLHYRMIDVSSFKEIFREKYGIKVEKSDKHRAIGDVFESIRELQTYLSYVQVKQ